MHRVMLVNLYYISVCFIKWTKNSSVWAMTQNCPEFVNKLYNYWAIFIKHIVKPNVLAFKIKIQQHIYIIFFCSSLFWITMVTMQQCSSQITMRVYFTVMPEMQTVLCFGSVKHQPYFSDLALLKFSFFSMEIDGLVAQVTSLLSRININNS